MLVIFSVDNLTVEGEVPKLINNRKQRQKEVFDAQEPPDVDLKTIQNLKQRLKQDSKRLIYKYLSELFIASISFEIKTNMFYIQLLNLFLFFSEL